MKRVTLCLFLVLFSRLAAQSIAFRSQISCWGLWNSAQVQQTYIGLRAIPELAFTMDFKAAGALDIEAALHAYGAWQTGDWSRFSWNGRIKPYRADIRWSVPRLEARLGLQKLSFGSAAMLRPLAWFDRIDPRDPLQVTDGVYALLLRAYFLGNANLWFWALYGNDEPRGWDIFPSDGKKTEFGGRLQAPLPRGELAFTYHHRYADIGALMPGSLPSGAGSAAENKFGLDGTWDVTLGIWFEAMLSRMESDALPFVWQRALTLGTDYTFPLGNGWHCLAEHLVWSGSRTLLEKTDSTNITALSVDSPLGITDFLMGMFYYDWENRNLYSFLTWRHILDRFGLHCILFWNPEGVLFFQTLFETQPYAGKGFQLMAVWNF